MRRPGARPAAPARALAATALIGAASLTLPVPARAEIVEHTCKALDVTAHDQRVHVFGRLSFVHTESKVRQRQQPAAQGGCHPVAGRSGMRRTRLIQVHSALR